MKYVWRTASGREFRVGTFSRWMLVPVAIVATVAYFLMGRV